MQSLVLQGIAAHSLQRQHWRCGMQFKGLTVCHPYVCYFYAGANRVYVYNYGGYCLQVMVSWWCVVQSHCLCVPVFV